nr:type II toxin-antitoxin system HicA family toxin [Campylobacter mucosalis]
MIYELKNNQTNVRFEILEKLLLANGFILKGVKGSHHQFSNGKLLLTLPYHKPMKPFYVKLVLKSIGEI